MKKLLSATIITTSIFISLWGATAFAICDSTTTGPDVITCNGSQIAILNGQAGDDQITLDSNDSFNVNSGSPAINGGGNNDTIIVQDTAMVTNANGAGISGGDGADQITITGGAVVTSNNTYSVMGGNGNDVITISGSATVTSNNDTGVGGNAGEDLITITDNAMVTGDFDGVNATGENDTIIVSGNAIVIGTTDDGIDGSGGDDQLIVTDDAYIYGEMIGVAGTSGSDTLLINGNATIESPALAISGGSSDDEISVTGNVVVNGGEAGIIGSGGNDIIVVEGYVVISGSGASIRGDSSTAQLDDGNDQITVGITVILSGMIDGGPQTDTLTLTGTTSDENGFNQVQALVGCNPCSGTVTIDGRTYTFLNFEQLVNMITLYVPPVVTPEVTPVEVVVVFDPPTPYDDMNCQNGVRCFALKDEGFRNGNVQIYAAEGDRGVGVATVNFRLLGTAGYTYTNPDNGWTVTITYLGTEGDARTYSIMLAKGDEVRNAVTTVLVFQYEDAVFTTHALAWR